eukprot:scaffold280983_cov71-Attheya_sp.AAC.7
MPTLISAQFQQMPPHRAGVSGYAHCHPSSPYPFAYAWAAFTTSTFPYFSLLSRTWPFFAILPTFASFIPKERGFLHLGTVHLTVIFGYLNSYCCISADIC